MICSKALPFKRCWLTRSEADNQRIELAVRKLGISTQRQTFLSLPVLHITSTGALPPPEAPEMVIFFSRWAVDQLTPELITRWQKKHMRFIAVGKSTAAAAARHFGQIETPETPSSEGLIQHLKKNPPIKSDRVLLVQGEGGRTLVYDYLVAGEWSVSCWRCYRRTPIQWTETNLQQVICFSPQLVVSASVEQWHAARPALEYFYHKTGNKPLILVVSKRIAEEVTQAGWPVAIAQDAMPETVARAIKNLLDKERHE